MVTYVIASKANHPFLAECEALGEFLAANCLNVTVKTVIKDREEWKPFLDTCCKSYGFKKRSCPIVYTVEGTLIGDCGQFITHVKERYLKQQNFTKDELKRRTADNVSWIQDLMRKKNVGPTLGETILEQLEKVKKKGLVNIVNDHFLDFSTENGIEFYIRRADFLQGQRLKDVPDEVQIEAERKKAFEEAEAKRDMTYEEFLSKYGDHIAGKAAPQKGKKQVVQEDDEAEGSQQGEDEEGEEGEDQSNPRTPMSQKKDHADGGVDPRFIVPPACQVQLIKKLEIAELDHEYRVIASPIPALEGELLILQQKKEDQFDDDLIVYKDHSLRKRVRMAEKPVDAQKAKEHAALLQSLFIDNEKPLSDQEWLSFAKIIEEVKGLGYFQLLPTGQKASQPLQFNMLHVLPSYKIPCGQLPLDVLISQKCSVLTREVKALIKEEDSALKKKQDDAEVLNETQLAFKRDGIVTLEEFEIPHAVALLEAPITQDKLKQAYKKLYDKLMLIADGGVTVLVSPQWMFLAPLGGPYLIKDQLPIYLNGYAFAGIVDLQTYDLEWPQTAGIDVQTQDFVKKAYRDTITWHPLDAEEQEAA